MCADTYVPTRFFALTRLTSGDLLLVNTMTGAIGTVPAADAAVARAALRRSASTPAPLQGVLRDLADGGFLLPEGLDERALRDRERLSKYDTDRLSLILLPTEQCNFRCVYCYESFLRGTMEPGIREGIKTFVANQRLRRLHLNWFGGEPLLASEVVIELTKYFYRHCSEQQIEFLAAMTTNGSLLSEEIARELIPYGVRYFQITLDGVREDHERTRRGADGHPTFDAILGNLRMLKSLEYPFIVALRHNFTPENLQRLPEFVEMLRQEFAGDPRFVTMFQPVGRWGGPNDATLQTCESDAAARAMLWAQGLALNAGIRNSQNGEQFRPGGYTCYAADPRSLVIGADGTVYKCTVELDYHDRNRVGVLHADGSLVMDWRKLALWVETDGLREGSKCNDCWLSPSCQGAICPKGWMDRGDVTCPAEKLLVQEALPLIARQNELPAPPPMVSVVEFRQ